MNAGESDTPLSADERIWIMLDRYLADDAHRLPRFGAIPRSRERHAAQQSAG